MKGFTYVPSESTGSPYRHFVTLAGQNRRAHSGSFPIAGGTGAPTGTQISVTGVGFQPQAVLIFDAIMTDTNGFLSDGDLGVGMAAEDGSSGIDQWAGHVFMVDLSGYVEGDWRDDQVIANGVYAHMVSFDSDGFTLEIDANNLGSGGDTYYAYLAWRGAGTTRVGTTLAPASTGTQVIDGLGFQPTSVFIASTMREDLSLTTDYSRYVLGGGDANGQWNVWTSYTAPAMGDVYVDELAVSGKIITFGIDSDPNVPSDPTPLAEAELDSLDADGFTLDWTLADGVQRYFSWCAIGGPSQVERFVYDGSTNQDIALDNCPAGLIFFMNGNGQDSSLSHYDNLGSGMSIGCADYKANQFLAGYLEASEPAFSVMRSVREFRDDCAFGAYGPVAGGVLTTTPNNQGQRGTVSIDCRHRFRPQIYRRVFN